MSISYAPMTISDYDEALALWQETEGMGLHLADVDSRGGVARFLQRNPGLSMVARDGARLVGTVLCGHDGRRGYMNHLAVSAHCRRHGVARALLSRCLVALRDADIVKCNAFVYSDNATGRNFWEHEGWNLREDLVIMQIDIADKIG